MWKERESERGTSPRPQANPNTHKERVRSFVFGTNQLGLP